jgi:hypothetical protein
MQRRWGHRCRLVCAIACAVAGVTYGSASVGVARAESSPPSLLWSQPSSGSQGSAAGQVDRPLGVATDPNSGHVFVADAENHRIDEFDIWGQFVKAWGWGVRTGAAELQTCTSATGCRAGLGGAGAGEFSELTGVAVDPADGDVYVSEAGTQPNDFRIQKFDPAGDFLFMLGGGVEKGPTSPGNLCTDTDIEAGDTCGAGAKGTGVGEFSNGSGDYIAVSSTGELYVGDVGRIETFTSAGSFVESIAPPAAGATSSTAALALDPSTGSLYYVVGHDTPEGPRAGEGVVYRRESGSWAPFAEPEMTNLEFGFQELAWPESLAVGSTGKVYVVVEGHEREIQAFARSGECLLCGVEGTFGRVDSTVAAWPLGLAVGSGCGLAGDDLYVTTFPPSLGPRVSQVSSFGPPPDATLCPPPAAAPTIASQYVSSAGTTSASVRAQVNPHFWPDTSYQVEYGTGSCALGECGRTVPAGAIELGVGTVDASVVTGDVELEGLSPHTTYHYRFVARSSGGGPVYGVDPDGAGPEEADFADGLEGTFTTAEAALPARPCANDAYRTGAGAHLPDCRAYELVSPLEKEGGDIIATRDVNSFRAALDQSAASGEAFTYSSYRSFGDNQSAPYTSQYLARREPATGWTSTGISAPRGPVPILKEGNTLQSEYRAFSEDLCQGWILHDSDPVLAPGAFSGYANLYRTQVCGGGYEALFKGATVAPVQEPIAFLPELQAVSASGEQALFRVSSKLTEEAATNSQRPFQLYEANHGSLELVNVLPGGAVCQTNASAGSESVAGTGLRTESVLHAISADGDRVYWECGGKLYLREGGESRPVSQTVSNLAGHFFGASVDGARAIFSVAGERLYEYEAEEGASFPLIGKLDGVLGISADGREVYAVSREALDGAPAGGHNLYLLEEGAPTYIATLSDDDAKTGTEGEATPSAVNFEPVKRPAEVSANGQYLAFASTASLTGFDNTDATTGEADFEVYFYDAKTGKLSCASCNAVGARPSGQFPQGSRIGAAAMLTPTDTELYQPRYLSASGRYLFFDSYDALVPRDTNGAEDVYEFEPASTQAGCEADGGELFVAREGACITLISGGTSTAGSEFLDASTSGRDAFFRTGESLVGWDPGQIDVYDARERGGLPAPATAPPECEGTACQSATPAPPGANPGSGVARPVPPPAPTKCPSGAHRVERGKRTICARPKSKKKSRRHRKSKHAKRHAGKNRAGGNRKGASR